MNDRHHLQRVFQRAFSVQDLAQPLLSFDETAPSEHVRTVMKKCHASAAGIRVEGLVAGYVESGDLSDGPCGRAARPIEPVQVVADATPLAAIVLQLRDRPWLFVSSIGQVAGVVRRADFQQAPARMWLFGMVTLLEMRFSGMIQQHLPGKAWHSALSEGRLHKAKSFWADRLRRNREVTLVDCLQWSDKIEIIASSDQLRGLTRFESKRQVREVGKQLERLRNNLAHSQDIVTDGWQTIVALAENLDTVLEGPPTPIETEG